MAVTYNWEIHKILTQDIESNVNVIVQVGWKYIGNDGTNTAEVSGISDFELGETFIDFENVTEENVKSWIEATFDEVSLSLLQEQITIRLNKITQASVEPTTREVLFPWASEPTANTSGE